MSLSYKFAFFIILFFSNIFAYACTIEGRWYDPMGQMGPWTFTQDNMIFTGIADPDINSKCGYVLATGTISNMNIYFDIYNSIQDKSEGCDWSSKAAGTLTENCYSIIGSWTDNRGQTGEFHLNRVPIKIIEPKIDNDLIITPEPKMPAFKAVATIDQSNPFGTNLLRSNQQPYTWHLVIDNEPISGIRKFQMTLDDVSTQEPFYEPDFNLLISHEIINGQEVIQPVSGGIVGGKLSLGVYYYKDINNPSLYPASDLKIYNIKGTNPGQIAIESRLTDSMSRQIACQESRYKQFDAARENGVGYPLIGKDENNKPIGGAGIMQLYKPQPSVDQFWNWHNNIKGGLEKISRDTKNSNQFHILERGRLNDERAKKGLPPCPDNIPTPLNSDQLIRDTIRRYNCGVEYRWEPRDALNCEGQWVSEPSCVRRQLPCDEDYVEHVLACDINR